MKTLDDLRLIVGRNMPYDTGYMFLAGANYYQNDHFMMAQYDLNSVEYIYYNEYGTIFTTKNQWFIRDQTVGEINYLASLDSAGQEQRLSGFSDEAKRRASTNLLKQGALDKISSEPIKRGATFGG